MENLGPEEIRNAVRLVVKKCSAKGEQVSESTALFMLRMMEIRQDWEQVIAGDTSPFDINDLIKASTKMMSDMTSPTALTLKMQVYFDLNYRTGQQFNNEHKSMHMKNVQPVLQRIVTTPCHSTRELENLHHEITSFVMLHEKVGNNNDGRTFKEMQSALSSLLPLSELIQFVELTRNEKKKRLLEISSVSSGIQLYNWHLGRGQSITKNVTDVIAGSATKLCKDLQKKYENTREFIQVLEGVLNHYFFHKRISGEEKPNLDFKYLKFLLIFLHQFAYFLETVQADVNLLAVRALNLKSTFRQAMQEVTESLSAATLIQQDIFEKYSWSSEIWKLIKEELLFLKYSLDIFQRLTNFEKGALTNCNKKYVLQVWNTVVGKKLESDDTKLSESEQPEDSSDSALQKSEKALEHVPEECLPDLNDINSSMKIIFPDLVSNFQKISLKLEGFCPWALVHGKGLLLQGDPNLGIVMYNETCYAFSCKKGQVAFCKDPDKCLDSVVDVIREDPALIVLLKLQYLFDMEMCNDDGIFESGSVRPTFISSRGCQTVLHPLEKFIDPKYEWNQWELRKLAVKYVDIRSKSTHSTQTDLSHFRRENFSQVYLPKNNWSQTKRDASTSMTKEHIPNLPTETWESVLCYYLH